ncbi:TraR/DksA C4-type zinc finger protein [Alkalihalophilus marmarensis]|uniref:TraR/DksA C4-type zinc finger protein n=1 Tax=Alkalihalophilus marmarensis TaxID=521377 RepID=UPI002E1F7BC2|nr:TraR/DksA C4-type zinc finger protein [Alkalihalophilus marmarensis]MED1602210.1 TraR/DksA C4-type zinc finger protein [Alkalihalophilus marmarensis]
MRNWSKQKRQLEEMKKSLEARINSDDHHESKHALSASTGELSEYDNHPADTATDLYEREKDTAIYAHLEKELADVNQALDKIENGTYGVCARTGRDIPIERLEANPTATTTVEEARAHIADDRPVEEEVLDSFGRYNYDDDDTETEFDAEDAYQSVARFNENSMIYEDASMDDGDELIGYVEELEGFLSTGIEGYTGDENVQFQRNVHYDHYMDEL